MNPAANRSYIPVDRPQSSTIGSFLLECPDVTVKIGSLLTIRDMARFSGSCALIRTIFDPALCGAFDASCRALFSNKPTSAQIFSFGMSRGNRLGSSRSWMSFAMPQPLGGEGRDIYGSEEYSDTVKKATAFSATVISGSVVPGPTQDDDLLDFLLFAAALRVEVRQEAKLKDETRKALVWTRPDGRKVAQQTLQTLGLLCQFPEACRQPTRPAVKIFTRGHNAFLITPRLCVAEEYLKLAAKFFRDPPAPEDKALGLESLTRFAVSVPAGLDRDSRARLLAVCFDHIGGWLPEGSTAAKSLFDAVLRMEPDTCGIDLWQYPEKSMRMLSYLERGKPIPRQELHRLRGPWSEDNWVLKALAQLDPARNNECKQAQDFGGSLVTRGSMSAADWKALFSAWKQSGGAWKQQSQEPVEEMTTTTTARITTTTTTTTTSTTPITDTAAITETKPGRKKPKSPLKRLSMKFSELNLGDLKQQFSPRNESAREAEGKERKKEKEGRSASTRVEKTASRKTEKKPDDDSSSEG